MDELKLVHVLFIGDVNAGKSSMFNKYLLDRRSAISHKRGTTVKYVSSLLDVKCADSTIRVVMYDSPGKITHKVDIAYDVCIYVHDARKSAKVFEQYTDICASNNVVLCINKMDLVKDKERAMMLADEINKMHNFHAIFFTSIKSNKHDIKYVMDYIIKHFAYSVDKNVFDSYDSCYTLEDRIYNAMRDSLFHFLNQELPYKLIIKDVYITNDECVFKIVLQRKSQLKILEAAREKIAERVLRLLQNNTGAEIKIKSVRMVFVINNKNK